MPAVQVPRPRGKSHLSAVLRDQHMTYQSLQLADNTSKVQSYAAGTVVNFKVDLAAHHTGYAVRLESAIAPR